MADLAPLHLLFETAQGTWAVPAALAEEVVELGSPREVPGTPPHVRGLLVLRGELLPVLDLEVLQGRPAGPVGPRGVLVRTGGGAMVLIARKVLGFEAVAPAPPLGASGLEQHLRGPVAIGSRQVLALDAEGLGAWLAG